jgi:hypothetical protein
MLALLAATGCSQRDEIASYEVLKPEVVDPTLVARPAATPGAKQQTIGLIVPAGETSWFFKLTGPQADVEPLEDDFLELAKTVKLSGGPDATPSWTLPDGWQQLPGSQFRYATIRVPAATAADKPQEISVSQAGGDVLANVNRWRGQLSLQPVSEAELGSTTKKMTIDGREATYVSFVGTGSGGMGGAPFAPFASGALPEGHPPIGTGEKTTSEPKKSP